MILGKQLAIRTRVLMIGLDDVVTEQQKRRFAGALKRLAGDCELLIAMAAMVNDDAPQVWKLFRQELEAGALSKAADAGHKLKGMLSTFETESPVLELQECILAARAGNLDDAKSTLRACESAIDQLLAEIDQLSDSVEA